MRAFALGLVRLLAAAAVLALALVLPSRLDVEPRFVGPPEPEPLACLDAACPEAIQEALVAQLQDYFSSRRPALGQPLHEALARAVVLEAEAAGVDPVLVMAMIEVESGFDPAAVSPAGARGLMQLQPATLRREAEALGLGNAEPHEPVANVRAGVRYLRRCLDSYPGHLDLALMAYNSGPNRIFDLLQTGALPAWALVYPRRVIAERRRLERALGLEEGPRVADARRRPSR